MPNLYSTIMLVDCLSKTSLVFAFLLFSIAANGITINSTGATADWNTSTTWDCGCIPTSADDVIIHHAVTIAAGTNSVRSIQIINDLGQQSSLIITGGTTSTISGGGGIIVTGNANAFLSLLRVDGAILTINGDLTFSSAQTGDQTTELRLNGAASLTVNGNFTFNYLPTDAVVEAQTEISVNNSSVLSIIGNVNLNYNSSIKPSSGLVINLDNSSTTTITGNLNLNSIEVGASGGSYKISVLLGSNGASTSSLFVGGDVQMNNSDLSPGTPAAICNTISADRNTNITINGNLSMNIDATTASNNTNRFSALRASVITVGGNVAFTNAATNSLFNRIDVGTAAAHTAIFDLNGNVTNPTLGRINCVGLTSFYLSGTIAQIIPTVLPNFTNLRIDNTSGTPVTIATNASISLSLTLTNGLIDSGTAGNLFFLNGATCTGGSSTRYIINGATKVGTSNLTIPLGAGTRWAPVDFSNYVGGNNNTTYIRANYLAASHPTTTTDGTFDHISRLEYWDIQIVDSGSGIVPPTSMDITLHWKDACGSQIYDLSTAPQDLFIGGYAPAGSPTPHWDRFSPSTIISGSTPCAGTGIGSISTTLTSAQILNHTNYTFAAINFSNNPLPVELISFKAHMNTKQMIDIQWTTVSELNSWKFEVEKSTNGNDWTIFEKVDAAGSSKIIKHYQVVDDHPTNGINYYRLSQYDLDNTVTISSIEKVFLENSANNNFKLFPNPCNELLQISSNQNLKEVTITVYDIKGISREPFFISILDKEIIINIGDLNNGIYHIVFTDREGNMESQLFIVAK